jgi:hypothetical protein
MMIILKTHLRENRRSKDQHQLKNQQERFFLVKKYQTGRIYSQIKI